MDSYICASKGYAIGEVYIYEDIKLQSFPDKTDNVETEIARLKDTVKICKKQIEEIARKMRNSVGNKEAEILESHISLLNDPEFIGEIFQEIKDSKKTSEKAVSDVVSKLEEIFSQFDDDEYLKERAADIKDVGTRLIRILSDEEQKDLENLPENSIIVAHDLKPSETARIDKDKVAGIITETGSQTSHTAIMARAMNITAIVGFRDILAKVETGDMVIIDGISGKVIINPDKDIIKHYKELKHKFEKQKEGLKKVLDKKIITKDGRKIMVAANIGSLAEVNVALSNGAEGIGLFRTEFLYMDRNSMPSEEEQFEVYKQVAQKMGNKPVIIRTLDIGGDKTLPYLNLTKEDNPFLGVRAIRLCLQNRNIFKIQLRALLRASIYGHIKIMFPMIGSLKELTAAKTILKECMKELQEKSIDFKNNMEMGMMVEIPAAAVMADEFAKHVDFFSIGTNDLIQYTLAVDRMNEGLSDLYNPMNPAVLHLIKTSIHAAHANGIPCYMCGEMAADFSAIPILLGYGLDEFSVSSASIPEVKNFILETINQ